MGLLFTRNMSVSIGISISIIGSLTALISSENGCEKSISESIRVLKDAS